jgi:hypothetical protein
VWSMFAGQLKSDTEELDAATQEARAPRNLSLAAKFAPSEGSHFSKLLGADKEISRLPWASRRARHRRCVASGPRQVPPLACELAASACSARGAHVRTEVGRD